MLLDELESPEVWLRFLRYKQESGHMRQQELQALEEFVTQKRYRPVVARIREGQPFPLPKRTELSKLHSQKKRIVYTYPEDENRVLKLLTWLLLEKYDSIFADNVYSFRPRKGVRDGVCSLVYAGNVGRLWSYKVDISNYFNSVPVDRLLPVLEETLADDPQTFTFLKGLLCEPMVLSGHTPIAEQKGIMAGTPISTFLANLYLKDMDLWFQNAGVLYARYADDIILFAPSQEQRDTLRDQLRQFLWEKGLSVPDAEMLQKIADVLESVVSQLLGAPIKQNENVDVIAEQLSRINEQLVAKNNRSRKIWKAVGIILAIIIVGQLLLVALGITAFKSYEVNTDTYEEHVEEITGD